MGWKDKFMVSTLVEFHYALGSHAIHSVCFGVGTYCVAGEANPSRD